MSPLSLSNHLDLSHFTFHRTSIESRCYAYASTFLVHDLGFHWFYHCQNLFIYRQYQSTRTIIWLWFWSSVLKIDLQWKQKFHGLQCSDCLIHRCLGGNLVFRVGASPLCLISRTICVYLAIASFLMNVVYEKLVSATNHCLFSLIWALCFSFSKSRRTTSITFNTNESIDISCFHHWSLSKYYSSPRTTSILLFACAFTGW